MASPIAPPIKHPYTASRKSFATSHALPEDDRLSAPAAASYAIWRSAWRKCLENRNGSRIWSPKDSTRGLSGVDQPPLGDKKARSRNLRLFSKHFRKAFSQKLVLVTVRRYADSSRRRLRWRRARTRAPHWEPHQAAE